MFDPELERPIPLTQVRDIKWMPGPLRGGKISPTTPYTWVVNGLKGVKLEAIQVGGTQCTSEAALKRFFASLTKVTKANVGNLRGMTKQIVKRGKPRARGGPTTTTG